MTFPSCNWQLNYTDNQQLTLNFPTSNLPCHAPIHHFCQPERAAAGCYLQPRIAGQRRYAPNLKQLEGTWLHAHEEDQGEVRVYRPNTYAFPPSRGRTGFAFDANGLFTQYDIAPTDGLEGHKGRWKAQNDHTIRISLDDKKEPDYLLEIVSLENQRAEGEAQGFVAVATISALALFLTG